MVLVLYTLAFIVGPALFLALVRKGGQLGPLAVAASVMAVLGLALRKEARLIAAPEAVHLFFSVFLIWLAWVLVLVLLVRAVSRVQSEPNARRKTKVLGTMGATAPWFGFAAAIVMTD